jgi:hypothetical protein
MPGICCADVPSFRCGALLVCPAGVPGCFCAQPFGTAAETKLKASVKTKALVRADIPFPDLWLNNAKRNRHGREETFESEPQENETESNAKNGRRRGRSIGRKGNDAPMCCGTIVGHINQTDRNHKHDRRGCDLHSGRRMMTSIAAGMRGSRRATVLAVTIARNVGRHRRARWQCRTRWQKHECNRQRHRNNRQ